MKLDIDELKELEIEMVENEEIRKESELYCEHEDGGDRV